MLVGRQVQQSVVRSTAQLVEAGRPPQHLVLTGLRGVGKTVLLKDVLRTLRDRGWLAGYYEVRRDVEAGVALSTIVSNGTELLPAAGRLREALRSAAGTIGGAKISSAADGNLSFSLNRQAATQEEPYVAAARLFRALGHAAADANVGVALCIDEIQSFRRKDATTLLQALESNVDADARVLLIGAGLPITPAELSKARTYAERFRYERLDDLSAADARLALVEPAERLHVRWEDPALERVISLAKGYPYFLQLYASETWLVAGTSPQAITLADVKQAEPRVARQLEAGLYATRYDRASQRERDYLQAMAALMSDGERVRSGAVAQRLSTQLSNLSPIRDRLIQKGVIYAPESGLLAFSVPGFRDYVIRRSNDS